MAVNLTHPQKLSPVAGIRIGAVDAGLRKSRGQDLAIISICETTNVAAVFTQNQARAAPVEVAIRHLYEKGSRAGGAIRALIVNSGNANAGLGQKGLQDCWDVCQLTAKSLGIDPHCIIPFSTGVIGEPLALEKFQEHIPHCAEALKQDNWLAAAKAIMTTDTVPKAVSQVVEVSDSQAITITAICKGSGMIKPNMATMLAFIATDAEIDAAYAQNLLNQAVDASFNCITVDGDTSTNDACVLMATGKSGVSVGTDGDRRIRQAFGEALVDVTRRLAQAIARDGEGATKFVTIHVTGGKDDQDCKNVAMSIANSPLVKTAFFAADPNWGRIYGAVGNAARTDQRMDQVNIRINDVEVMKDGAQAPAYREQDAALQMKADEFTVSVSLGPDLDSQATVWTTDLSYEYIRINADYRS